MWMGRMTHGYSQIYRTRCPGLTDSVENLSAQKGHGAGDAFADNARLQVRSSSQSDGAPEVLDMLTWKPFAQGRILLTDEIEVPGADERTAANWARNPASGAMKMIMGKVVREIQSNKALTELFGVADQLPPLVYTTGDPRATDGGAIVPFTVYLPS